MKSRNPQKAHLDHPLYVHVEFQPPTSIGRSCECDTRSLTIENTEKSIFWSGSGLKSRNPQKAHLDHLLHVHVEFQPSTSIRRGCGRDTRSETIENTEKSTFWRLKRGGMGLKSRNPQKAHLDHPLHVHVAFQPPTSIRIGCGRDTNFFKVKTGSKNRFSSLLIDLGN